ncbi:adenylate/guanylate cyclase domain-containing protein [Tychonema sp. LEGE 07203]|uniref:adenylate/guanylate cyclase domain-containing protein n=1 Tax=Tychonema sp. LEGE 07203 TaxID=1828671 RepID=UPI001D157E38|nr:adenylate/guanylate cyclase domain-containing protein [Tychonema sp. LEGE 07203]
MPAKSRSGSTIELNSFSEISLWIGVDSGPILAGIIGNKNFACDVWGNTVTAYSM